MRVCSTEIATQEINIVNLNVIFEEDFETEGLGQMTAFSAIGEVKQWGQASYSGNHYAYMNAYQSGSNEASWDWLMTPQLTPSADGMTLSFRSAKNFNGNDLELKYSTNYTGFGDPTNATSWNNVRSNATTTPTENIVT